LDRQSALSPKVDTDCPLSGKVDSEVTAKQRGIVGPFAGTILAGAKNMRRRKIEPGQKLVTLSVRLTEDQNRQLHALAERIGNDASATGVALQLVTDRLMQEQRTSVQ
jgi:hypothetical protein